MAGDLAVPNPDLLLLPFSEDDISPSMQGPRWSSFWAITDLGGRTVTGAIIYNGKPPSEALERLDRIAV